MQPFVSVVTPVYNTEKYLTECIESILNQTYRNWEYVIVNNCSTDRSLEIARHFADRDARIRIHDNSTFLGQMPNCNHALRQISPRSKYCKIVHADDWIFPECLARMVQVAEAHESVGIVGSYRLDELEVNLDGLPFPSEVTPGREICRRFFLDRLYVFGSPTSLLIRSDLIRKRTAFYDESYLQADIEACLDILGDSDFGFVHQVLTYTRRHNESASNKTLLFGAGRLGNLKIMKKFGAIYLSEEELSEARRFFMKHYYRFLAQSIFRLRKALFRSQWRDFHTYQKNSLAELGLKINWKEVVKNLPAVLAMNILNRIS